MIKKLLCIAILLWPAAASAWEQTMTCDDYTVPCSGAQPLPTHWEKPCVAFHLNESGSSDLDFDDIRTVVSHSIETWNRPGDTSLRPHFSGLTDETRVGFNPYTEQNANIIVFRDKDWNESRTIMALTTVTHHNKTGAIKDADIEVNTEFYPFGICEKDGPNYVDLQNTLTHELGHAFGLAHSGVPEATMFPYSGTGDTSLSTLDKDDIEGISAIYPPDEISCKFKDEYFSAPPFAMNEMPPSDSCSAAPAHPARSGISACILMTMLCILSLFSRRRHA